ncbi:hypothetical protein L204_102987 [Cryptococcus depauperatus]
MGSSNNYPWSRQSPQTHRDSPKSSPSPKKHHSRQESEVINASGVRHPSANHRPHASMPHSPSTLRPRSSPRKVTPTDRRGLSHKISSPSLTVPTESNATGAERIIKGTSKWLRDKLDLGNDKDKDGGWLVLDLPVSPFNRSPRIDSSSSIPVPTYDERGYPAKDSSDRRRTLSQDRNHAKIEKARITTVSSPAMLPSGSLTSDPGIHSFLSKTDKGKKPLGYSHNAVLSSFSAHFPPTPKPIPAKSPKSLPNDFYPDTRGLLSNSLSNDPKPTSSMDSPRSSIMTRSSVYSWNGSDADSVTRLHLHDDSPPDRKPGKRKEKRRLTLPPSPMKRLGRFAKSEKQKLYDLLPFHVDPALWTPIGPEDDDELHRPDNHDQINFRYCSGRGLANLGCLAIILFAVIILFAGYPLISYYASKSYIHDNGGFNIGGINATGQVPNISNIFQLIDPETPPEAYHWTSMETGKEWDLVFSDEFNTDGRTFWNGDDPFWEAVDLHYWQTNNLEWYDPGRLTTKNGKLVITLDKIYSHGRNFEGGMMSSWNRFCFTGGYIEVSVSLPGKNDVPGLWPAIWTMGNLGRAGYGGTLDGTWPYSYDSCDVGTLSNQTLNGEPEAALTMGSPSFDMALSYLPGQRLSRCTCLEDETHPGPKHLDGSFIGRAAPEIDVFEATVDLSIRKGQVSQSGQWAPFNAHYNFLNTSKKYYEVVDQDVTHINGYMGSVYQQATSALSITDQVSLSTESGCFSVYGFEYGPGADGYISWVSNAHKAWTVRGAAMGPNEEVQVGQRLVSEEPMYIILNLGISENFGAVDFHGLDEMWPVTMEVDYVRVYQDPNNRNIGCDPKDRPTSSYIARYPEAYSNPNITTFDQVPNRKLPKNRLVDRCQL